MKNLLKTFSLFTACIAMIFMYSCDQDSDAIEQEQGGVEFLFNGDRVSNGRSSDSKDGDQTFESCDINLASYAVIEMEGVSYTIDLKEWGNSIKTELIELPPGDYEVTSSQLYDADDNPLYATPNADSEFGPFVNTPLPFTVTVENFRKIEYDLEVLCVEDFTPPQFGFVFWDITIKEVKNLCIFANFCDPEDGHEVATIEAFIYPNENQTSEADLIWSGSADGDFNSEDESNELLCLKFPYDSSIPTEDQSYFIELLVNGVPFQGTMPLDRVDMINDEEGYLHLNENCAGDFDVFSNSYNIAWEDLRGNDGEGGSGNDADYNDFVMNTTSFTDINTGFLNFRFEPMARGGGYAHAFKFWLPGTGYVISGGGVVTVIGGNTEVEVYADTNQAFNPNQNFINTRCNGATGSGIVKTITIEVAPNDFTFYLINPFDANLNVTGGGSNYDLTIGNLFAPSTFIKDGQVMRNGLITDMNWNWVQEGVDIRTVYGPNFETNFVPIATTDLYVNCP